MVLRLKQQFMRKVTTLTQFGVSVRYPNEIAIDEAQGSPAKRQSRGSPRKGGVGKKNVWRAVHASLVPLCT